MTLSKFEYEVAETLTVEDINYIIAYQKLESEERDRLDKRNRR